MGQEQVEHIAEGIALSAREMTKGNPNVAFLIIATCGVHALCEIAQAIRELKDGHGN